MKPPYPFVLARGLALVLLACTGHATGAEQGGAASAWRAGMYDAKALELLRHDTAVLKLRTTHIKDVAPKYHVEAPEALTWEQALTVADDRFGEDMERRALFLRKFLPVGVPADRLAELKLPEMGYSTGVGSGHSVSYGLGVTEKKEPVKLGRKDGGEPRISTTMTVRDALATITFWKTDKIQSPAELTIRAVRVGNAVYSLSFDARDKLDGFRRSIPLPDTGFELRIEGNTSGEDDTDYFAATAAKGGQVYESFDFAPDLKLKRRFVNDSATGRIEYAEFYRNGRLHKRCHYAERKTGDGSETVITKTETFPTHAAPDD